ncbi:MAG: branched-chain amino acid ABC transporter permease [Candidatus Thorarchaeota archaeon]
MSTGTLSSSLEYIQKEYRLIAGVASIFLIYLGILLYQLLFVHRSFGLTLQIFMNGAVLSAIYSTIALGFSLIFGIAKQLKLSIGGYYVVAAYAMFFLIEARAIVPSPNTAISVLTESGTIDGFIFILIAYLPLIVVIAALTLFWRRLNFRHFMFVVFSVLVAIAGHVLQDSLRRAGFVVSLGTLERLLRQGFSIGAAILLLGFALLYLELPEPKVIIGMFGLATASVVINFLGISSEYIALMVLSISLTAFLAMISDRYLLEKVRYSHVNVLIVTFSLALVLQSIIQIIYFPRGGNELVRFGEIKLGISYDTIVPQGNVINIYGALIKEVQIYAFLFVVVAVLLLYLFIWKTKMGAALRAVSQDEEAAALSGIDIRKSTAIVSGIGVALISFAAVLTSPFTAKPQFGPFMGWWVLIIAIAIVTVGGLGSLPGSIVASIILAYAVVIVSSLPDLATLSWAIPLIVVLIVMIVKPEGIFGERKELEA